MTIRAAKGLEWQAVFLPALMKGYFQRPGHRQLVDEPVGAPPADLRGAGSSPARETTYAGMVDYKQNSAGSNCPQGRVGLRSVTRAKRLLVGTGRSAFDLNNARAASSYLQAIVGRRSVIISCSPGSAAGADNPPGG